MRFHTKSKLRDKTPRGKQLVLALTEVGITLWQKNWRECRGYEADRTGCRTPYRIPLPEQMQHDFSENSAGRHTADGTKFGVGSLLIGLPGGFGSPKISRALQTANPTGETCAAGRTPQATLRLRDTRSGPHPP